MTPSWSFEVGDPTLARPPRFDKPRSRARLSNLGLALSALLVSATGLVAQAPDEDWKHLSTEHFALTFPAPLEDIARRAGARAERAYALLADAFINPPKSRIDLILTDHTDTPNGFATVFPSDRITLIVKPPVSSISLQYFDDWLELLITHELTHVFHLDRSHPVGTLVRGIMGRAPLLWPIFPNTLVPTWTLEGLATHFESELTGSGRSTGTYHEMVVRTAALEDAFESLDQVSGESPVWPAGPRPYIYGSAFFDYLTDKHGKEGMGRFVDAVEGQWIPFRINAAARSAFGTSFSDAWENWEAELKANGAPTSGGAQGGQGQQPSQAPQPTLVLDHGRFALHPRVSPDGRHLALSRSDGRTNSQLRVYDLNPEGLAEGEGSKRSRTNGFATFAWAADNALIFAQQEQIDPYRSYSDLYRADASGRITRITHGQRISEPALSADATTAVAVQDGEGGVRLVEVDLSTGALTALTERDASELWTGPALSPDGRWIAASRWTPGGYLDVVVLDRSGTVVHEVTTDRAADTWPTWSPDGTWLVWASDRSGVSDLYGAQVDPASGRSGAPKRITSVDSGVTYPAFSPDGRHLYFSRYHADGWDVERVAVEPALWADAGPLDRRFAPELGRAAAESFEDGAGGAVEDYSPWGSLLPRYWLPSIVENERLADIDVLGWSYGLNTGGRDLVGRHAWSADARYEPAGERFSGGASYTFAGMGTPLLGFGGAQSYDADPLIGLSADSVRVQLFEVERTRAATASLVFPRIRRRSFLQLGVSGSGLWTNSELLETSLLPSSEFQLAKPSRTLAQGAVSLSWSNVQAHAFSFSGEDGASLSLQGRTRVQLDLATGEAGQPGLDDSFDDAIGVLRLFKALDGPGYARHVVGVRGAAGAARGAGAGRGHFDLGGASGAGLPIAGFGSIGSAGLLFPLRGYPRDVRSGRVAWTASLEYRFPLALIHRGLGAMPMYFDRMWGAVFMDAGDAWGERDGFEVPNPRTGALSAAGAELGLRLVPLWFAPVDVRFGGAVPLVDALDPVSGAALGRTARFWIRFGAAF